ncbi:MAG TPA: TrkH family potassium uptake protein [Acidobacteriota bacterium]|jgi:trk system potassium uptake protein TrkH|nr:TrkH family potassium uptake protein [Acidobacteriota bacterium]
MAGRRDFWGSKWERVLFRLGRVKGQWWVIFSFVTAAFLGGCLLMLPWCSHEPGLRPVDALFTATSAVCVTGLVVVDTGSRFTPLGQFVILALIQLGALGIITVSSFFAIILGKKMPLLRGEVVRETHFAVDARSFATVVRRIIWLTFLFEGIGAGLLYAAWHRDFATPTALWAAVFHAVSAFCNAGFSLFPDSLVRYAGDILVNLTIMALIVCGGLGFLVIHDVERRLRWGIRLSLHSRLALAVTAVLLAGGAALLCLLEWGNALRGLPMGERFLVALFQSVTARTAGFNTVPIVGLTNPSLVLLTMLMFIGGSSGSTAGGVKTTTIGVMLAAAINRIQGRSTTNLLNRTIPEKVVNSSLAVVMISVALLFCFYFGLQWSETGWIPHPQSGERAFELLFEAVSAFGTVGLSTGITPELTDWGKLQVICLMLIGRIGPLIIVIAVSRRSVQRVQYEFYRENVMVG